MNIFNCIIMNEKELLRTRAAGFGGSDAAMVLAIAERIKNGQPLTMTQRHRLRVIKGLELPTASPDTERTRAGHDFEATVFRALPANWEREALLEAEWYSENFSVFAHADFYSREMNAAKECKWSRKFDVEGLKKEYAAQLQWYYLCGAQSVSLCYDTEAGQGAVDIPFDITLDKSLKEALRVIDEAWNTIDLNICELSGGDIPNDAIRYINGIRDLDAEIKTLDEQRDKLREKLAERMKAGNHTKYSGDFGSVTLTQATVTKRFDSKKFEKDNQDIYAAYLTDSKRKETLTIKFTEK